MPEVTNKISKQIEELVAMSSDDRLRITNIIEEEGEKTRKEADHKSADIIAGAKEQYKQRLIQFLMDEAEKIKKRAAQEIAETMSRAREEKEHIITEARIAAQLQAEKVIAEVKKLAEQEISRYTSEAKQKAERRAAEIEDEAVKRAEQEAAKIVEKANFQARQIIAESEAKAKQAESEKRQEADSIIGNARQQAAKIIAETRQVAEQALKKVVTDAMKEAEERSRKIIALDGGKAEVEPKAQYNVSAQITSEDYADNGKGIDSIEGLVEQHSASPSDSVGSILKATLGDAGKAVDSVEQEAEAEAGHEESGISSQERTEIEELGQATIPAGGEQGEVGHKAGEEEAGGAEEIEGEPSSITADESSQLIGENVMEHAPGAIPTEMEKPAAAVSAEDKKEPVVAEKVEGGEAEIVLGLLVDPTVLTKLHLYLKNTPGIQVVRTVGSSKNGAIITVALDKPISLVEGLSANIPEAEVTSELEGKDGKHKVQRINIAAKGR